MSESGGYRSQAPRRSLFPELVLPPADTEPVPLTRPVSEPLVTVAPQPVRRVLPDLSPSAPATSEPDAIAAREPRSRAPRGRRKAAAEVNAPPVISSDRIQRKKPERVAAVSDAVSAVQPAREQEARPATVVPAVATRVHPVAEPTGVKRGKRRGLSQVALRKAKRHGLPMPALGPGERWKRRLPLACR
jgi:hypothetical protein